MGEAGWAGWLAIPSGPDPDGAMLDDARLARSFQSAGFGNCACSQCRGCPEVGSNA